jgi:cytochrome b
MNFITWNESWKLFVFCVSWNYARDIWTVFEEIKHQSCTRKIFYQIIKINKTQILLKYYHWGLMKKTILDEVVFILFLSYICIWLLRADIPSFLTEKIASQISTRHLSHNCVGNNIVVALLVLVKICHIMTQMCFMFLIHHLSIGGFFSYYFCGGNWSTQRNQQICRKSLTNFIT